MRRNILTHEKILVQLGDQKRDIQPTKLSHAHLFCIVNGRQWGSRLLILFVRLSLSVWSNRNKWPSHEEKESLKGAFLFSIFLFFIKWPSFPHNLFIASKGHNGICVLWIISILHINWYSKGRVWPNRVFKVAGISKYGPKLLSGLKGQKKKKKKKTLILQANLAAELGHTYTKGRDWQAQWQCK